MKSDRRYTNAYAQMADGVQTTAESKLNRSLTDAECNGIRNAGSLLMLESVAMVMEHAMTAEEVNTQLADAVAAFPSRLSDALNDVQSTLESKLNRPLNSAESELVSTIPNCLEAMLALHKIEDAGSISDATEIMP